MIRIRTFGMMVLATSFFIFYLTIQLEKTKVVSAVRNVTKMEEFTTMPSLLQTVVVSNELKQLVPRDGAYWNRLLYSALKSLENGENPMKRKLSWLTCREENKDLLQLNVHDFSVYPGVFKEFVQGMNCRFPPVLIDQPDKCQDIRGDNQTLLFAIKSSPRNFERRQAVREAWGREGVHQFGMRVRLVFFLGSTTSDEPDVSALLSFEANHFRDLLQWDFHESLLNLTLKMNSFLLWTVKNCPSVSFVFSGDDDVFVNTPGLITYLQSLDASKASQLYAGHIINSASPLRDKKSKYYIPLSFYNGPYPDYAGGGGFLFSGSLLHSLYSVAQVVPFFPIDDVYMGMLMKALGISPVRHEGFQTFDVRQQDRENVCVHKGNLLIHQRFPPQILKMWKGINNPLLTC